MTKNKHVPSPFLPERCATLKQLRWDRGLADKETERVRSSPRIWRTVIKRLKHRSSQIVFAKNLLFRHPVPPTVRGTGSHLKVGPWSGRNGGGSVFVFAKNVANGPKKAKT